MPPPAAPPAGRTRSWKYDARGRDREARRRRHARPAAQPRPHEHREDWIQKRIAPAEHDEDHDRECRQKRRPLTWPGGPAQRPGTAEPRQDHRSDQGHSRGVAEAPGQPAARRVGAGDGSSGQHGRGPDRRRERRAHDGREQERAHVPGTVERVADSDPAQQPEGGEAFERIPDADPHGRERRNVRQPVRQERADEDAGPEGRAAQQERGQSDSRRGPDRGDVVHGEVEAEADPGHGEVHARQDGHLPEGTKTTKLHGQGPFCASSQHIRGAPRKQKKAPACAGATFNDGRLTS